MQCNSEAKASLVRHSPNQMISTCFTIHPAKYPPPPQNGCRLKSFFIYLKKHWFHILHFRNATRLLTKPTGHHYTKYRFSLDIALVVMSSSKVGVWIMQRKGEGHFPHEPRARDRGSVRARRKMSKGASPRHFRNHVVWSRMLE